MGPSMLPNSQVVPIPAVLLGLLAHRSLSSHHRLGVLRLPADQTKLLCGALDLAHGDGAESAVLAAQPENVYPVELIFNL